VDHPYVPARQGDLVLQLQPGNKRLGLHGADSAGLGSVAILLPGEYRPFATLPNIDGLAHENLGYGGNPSMRMHHDKRVHLFPDSKLLLTIPSTNDRLLLSRFDLDELLEKGGTDYLLITSRPLTTAIQGKLYTYNISVKSKKGEVKYRLDGAPDGMKVSADGKLAWDVPPHLAGTDVDIILTVTDASGQEVFHTFKIAIKDGGEEAVAAPQAAGAPRPVRPAIPGQAPLLNLTGKLYVPKAGKESRRLAGVIQDVAFGGGGRFLLLQMATLNQIAVFDCREGEVVKYLPLADATVKFAAGATRLVVLYPKQRLLEVWNLNTLEREKEGKLPAVMALEEFGAVRMGSATEGPLFVALPKAKRTFMLDFQTLATREIPWKHWGERGAWGPEQLQVSADGSILVGIGGGWAGLEIASLRGGQVLNVSDGYSHELGKFALPTHDGRQLLTGTSLLSRGFVTSRIPGLQEASLVPAHERGYFLAVGFEPGRTAVYTADARRLFVLNGVDMRSLSSLERCIHYYPTAGLLITLAMGKPTLTLHRVDLGEMLEAEGGDYLHVVSQPPDQVRRGTNYTYPVVVKSRKGGVLFDLAAGPPGMTVAADGRVSWAVPENLAEAEVDVILTIRDAGGKEIFHTFAINIAP
jgi:hypothetical protein